MKLKRIFNPLFWREKTTEYDTQRKIEPSRKIELKTMASALAETYLGLTIVSFIYYVREARKPETINKMKENVRNSLLEKGFSQDEISKYL